MRGLSMPVALSEQDAMRLLFEGETNRAIAEHQLNKSSSRCVWWWWLDGRAVAAV